LRWQVGAARYVLVLIGKAPDGMVEPEPGSTPTQGAFSYASRVMVRIAGTGSRVESLNRDRYFKSNTHHHRIDGLGLALRNGRT
jgi:hypothetical protein